MQRPCNGQSREQDGDLLAGGSSQPILWSESARNALSIGVLSKTLEDYAKGLS
jgi:hypothetical protein